MADKPILFSGPMVRALLAGTKTQTRRVVPKQPTQRIDGLWDHHGYEYGIAAADDAALAAWLVDFQRIEKGDRLYVREAWQTGSTDNGPQISYRATPDYCAIDAWDGPDEGAGPSFNYDRCPKADFSHWLSDVLSNDGPWRPGIHMPRWASRITLTVTDVRVERLQDISEEDAVAEGVAPFLTSGAYVSPEDTGNGQRLGYSAYELYRDLWNSINGDGSWATNPWVAAYTFTVEHGNIDQLRAAA